MITASGCGTDDLPRKAIRDAATDADATNSAQAGDDAVDVGAVDVGAVDVGGAQQSGAASPANLARWSHPVRAAARTRCPPAAICVVTGKSVLQGATIDGGSITSFVAAALGFGAH